MKVSIIGVGNVGAIAALSIVSQNAVDDLVLLDIKEGLAEGIAVDLSACNYLPAKNERIKITGVTNDYSKTENSNIIVITSGSPRKPGMSREDLVEVNSKILGSILIECYKYSKNAIYIIVSNPVDTMSYMAVKVLSKLSNSDYSKKVLGFGNILDSRRFEANIPINILDKIYSESSPTAWPCCVFGGHGDTTMIPMIINYFNPEFTSEEKKELAEAIRKTKVEGKTITELKGSSAYLGPGSILGESVSNLAANLLYASFNHHQIEMGGYSFYMEDEDLCIGVPVSLAPNYTFIVNNRLMECATLGHKKEWDNAIEKIRETNKHIIWPNI